MADQYGVGFGGIEFAIGLIDEFVIAQDGATFQGQWFVKGQLGRSYLHNSSILRQTRIRPGSGRFHGTSILPLHELAQMLTYDARVGLFQCCQRELPCRVIAQTAYGFT